MRKTIGLVFRFSKRTVATIMSVTVLIKHLTQVFRAYLVILQCFIVSSLTGKGGSKGTVICWQSQDRNCKSPVPVFSEPAQKAAAHRASKAREERPFLIHIKILTNF